MYFVVIVNYLVLLQSILNGVPKFKKVFGFK